MSLSSDTQNCIYGFNKLFNPASIGTSDAYFEDTDERNKYLAISITIGILFLGIPHGIYGLAQLGKYIFKKITESSNEQSKNIKTSIQGTPLEIKVPLLQGNGIPKAASMETIDCPVKPNLVNLAEANEEIRVQVERAWPKKTSLFQSQVNSKILCYCLGNQLLGCTSLEHTSLEHMDEENSKRTYGLDIFIMPEFQNKGWGRKLFEESCALVIDQGHKVVLTDSAAQGIGDKLYGGEKTRQKFDVSILIHGFSHHMYTLSKKRGEAGKPNPLTYKKIDHFYEKLYIPYLLVESISGIKHLNEYLRQNEDHQKYVKLDTCLSKTMKSTYDNYMKSDKEQKEYTEQTTILKKRLHHKGNDVTLNHTYQTD